MYVSSGRHSAPKKSHHHVTTGIAGVAMVGFGA
ncbi:MAG: hypothetical protein K0R68_1136, partial [Mycobacterium sp.]|nr:hypothetical protein [Mycobacterium sp.]